MPNIAVVDSGFDISTYAYDRPNYILPGLSVKYDGNYYLGNDVQEYLSDHHSETISHGTTTAALIGSPDNGNEFPDNKKYIGYCGVAPGANIYPIKVSGVYNEQAMAHAIYQASFRNVDVIAVPFGTAGNMPLSWIPSIRNEIYNAYSVRGKIVVLGAGNNQNVVINDSDYSVPDSLEIIVGGTENQSSGKSKAWTTGSGSTYSNRVHLAAAAHSVGAPAYNITNGARSYEYLSGTSNSTPIVAAAAGMIKKFAQYNGNNNITAQQVRSILTYSSHLATYNAIPNPLRVEKFLGSNLSEVSHNVDRVDGRPPTANIRELNLYNALILAKYSHQYNAISRIFNIDDEIQGSVNYNWSSPYAYYGYNSDAFYGISNLSYGENLSFRNYNGGGGRAFGYQIYKQGLNYFDYLGGVVGVSGAYNDSGSTGWFPSIVYQNY